MDSKLISDVEYFLFNSDVSCVSQDDVDGVADKDKHKDDFFMSIISFSRIKYI